MGNKFHLFSYHRFTTCFNARSNRNGEIRIEPKAKVIRMTGSTITENRVRRIFETDKNLGGGHGQAFAGPNIERHSRPTPVIDVKTKSDKRLNLGIRYNA